MPVLEGRHDRRQIIIPVLVAPPLSEPSFQIIEGRALIDTGATSSLITTNIAEKLQLPRRGKQPLVSARSTELVNRYAFRLGFVLAGGPYMIDADLVGSEFRDHGNFNVIIGMDVLGQGDFSLRRNGTFSFAF